MEPDYILTLLAEGHTPEEVACSAVDDDVDAGEYEGCSTELEIAYEDYLAQAKRVLAEVGGA